MTKVMCDSLFTFDYENIVRINVQGQNVYMPGMQEIVAYKVLQALQSTSKDPNTLKRDFALMHEFAIHYFTHDELVSKTVNLLKNYEDSINDVRRMFSGNKSRYIDEPILKEHFSRFYNNEILKSGKLREFVDAVYGKLEDRIK